MEPTGENNAFHNTETRVSGTEASGVAKAGHGYDPPFSRRLWAYAAEHCSEAIRKCYEFLACKGQVLSKLTFK